VLVGTVSVETSEMLSRMLKKEGLIHSVLNAKYHEQEAEIVARAGQRGGITIATNMVGRGTDIKLGPGVVWNVEHKPKLEGVAQAVTKGNLYKLTEATTGEVRIIDSISFEAAVFNLTPQTKVAGGLH